MEKSYRIHTNIASDTVLNVNMQQDFDFLEVLSLKLRQSDAYKLHSSNYGVIVGRVLANDAFGVPNAKVSVFIERDDSDSTELENIYPYTEVTTKDKNDIRYNLLPDYSDDSCYRVVGTFPNKRLLLDDDTQVEVYDKYWKYTTVTNQAGDYMIFGVPTGSQTVHVDVDLSDIGILSQKPRDMIYKGDNETSFDSSVQFKESTNLETLKQIMSQDKSVNVYSFWGDADNGIAAITRSDIQLNYKFEPTCVFMGSIISDNDSNSIGHDCRPSKNNGMNDQLVAGNGTIEMIRKTTDGLVEEYPIRGNQLIDEDGVWCYQIPMNLDYVGTDEYGNVVATDNVSKGIPTRAQVRFRISKTETGDEGFSRHTAKYLVPMNPIFSEDKVIPTIDVKGSEIEKMYQFGSSTPDSCFRDLYWNNVYSVKNYIPKSQRAHRAYSSDYTALKGSNLATDQNSIPFNKLRIDLPFSYMLICILVTIVMYIIAFVNATFICVVNITLIRPLHLFKEGVKHLIWPLSKLSSLIPAPDYIGCISLAAGLTEGNTTFFPGCYCDDGLDAGCCAGDSEDESSCNKDCEKSSNTNRLMDSVQRSLALEYKIVKLDFYHDWINGTLYMPLWYWRKRAKKTFLFGLFSSSAKNDFCSCDSLYTRLKTKFACSIGYKNNSLDAPNQDGYMPLGQKKWHKSSAVSSTISYKRGLIKPFVNKDGLTVYYYNAIDVNASDDKANQALDDITSSFQAVRLYATDIILLGNLNENNLYGIPQFYKCLPSTTSNIPPIATVQEAESEETDTETDYDTSSAEESGTTTTTGMDWGYTGDDQQPMYKDGLFMDLGCTSVKTRAKACVNVERLSELGSNLDIQYSREYAVASNPSNLVKGKFETDGFINKLELDDFDNRAMFATLNHIGFIPQSYQDAIGAYDTQINDENTSYLVNKFKYIYPINFDGRLKYAMDAWRNGFGQALGDVADESYITFRLGAEKSENKSQNSEERIRHFYEKSGGRYALPLYNNSFYFYFGVKKGSTAIDKFNKQFVAECSTSSKHAFTLDVSKKNVSYCPSIYKNEEDGYGWIKVVLDDIQAPYSYTLYDSHNSIVVSENDMSLSYFIIGGKSESVDGDVTPTKTIYYQKTNEDTKKSLSNQAYTLEVTDSNGKTISTVVTLSMSYIQADFVSQKLGTKFENENSTKISYICNSDNFFNGIISFSNVVVDNYNCKITSANGRTSGNSYVVNVMLEEDADSSSKHLKTNSLSATIVFSVVTPSEVKKTEDCLCKKGNSYADSSNMYYNDTSGMVNSFELWFKNGTVQLYVYRPCSLTAKVILDKCTCSSSEGSVSNCNLSISTINVGNGETFDAKLNTMPVRFMLGTCADDAKMSESTNSYFYNTSVSTSTTEKHLIGWFGVNDENAYKFADVNTSNNSVWNNYVTLEDDILSSNSELNIIKFKFSRMFSLSDGIFSTSSSNSQLKYNATGGVNPILYRTLSPTYSTPEKMITGRTVLNDSSQVSLEPIYPLIVGNNYSGTTEQGPSFNPLFLNNREKIGNYFAAFTHNGGYIDKKTLDKTINCQRIISYSSVSPLSDNTVKVIGTDKNGTIDSFKYVYESGSQTLANDKKREVKPYLRVMTIDRRMNYSFTILAPVLNSSMHINDVGDNVWKKGRLFGNIYGGIEMSYDSDYNIISAVTNYSSDGSITKVEPSKRLEYTYQCVPNQNNSTYTTYNNRNGVTNCVWNSENNGYDKTVDTDNSPLIKQFYSADLANTDIRQFLWSTFNKNRLTTYCNALIRDNGGSSKNAIMSDKMYVWKYPSSKISEYANGEFDPFPYNASVSTQTLKENYPTKRYVDISGLPRQSSYNFDIQSCGYDIDVSNSNNVITAKATGGESTEIEIDFSSPIEFLSSSSANTNDYNAHFAIGKLTDGYYTFKKDNVSLDFKYKSFELSDYDVITYCPRMIKVLPYTNGIDGITFYKTANNQSEGLWGDGYNIDDALSKISTYYFNKKPKNVWIFTSQGTVYTPDGVDIANEGEPYAYFVDSETSVPLTNNDDDFSKIEFHTRNFTISDDSTVFAILVTRKCYLNDSSLLEKNITIHETSELFDCRNIYMTVSSYNSFSGPGTYISLEDNVLYQHVLFSFKKPTSKMSDECQLLSDIDNVEFEFVFNDGSTSYTIDSYNVSEKSNVIEVRVKWDADMKTIVDWGNKAACSVYIKTVNSSFTYKLGEFNISCKGVKPSGQSVTEVMTDIKLS